jgi:EAL domain-containing protein (putative c-di-GMP-specific phosphodiesterase class I)
VDFLKIDGSFVKDIADDPMDLAMVQAINAVGHVMALKSIAESVVSEAILKRLYKAGVDDDQGCHLGKPQPQAAPGRLRPPTTATAPASARLEVARPQRAPSRVGQAQALAEVAIDAPVVGVDGVQGGV